MIMNKRSEREKIVATVLFWSVAVPAIFTLFLRTFFIFFNFIYGALFVVILGQEYVKAVVVIALMTSIGFTIGVVVWVHKQYKKHILTTFQ
jgi:hypothetical protein